MNTKALCSIITDQREYIQRTLSNETVIDRRVLDHWKDSIRTNLIKVIYGVRRCGKSTFSLQILQSQSHDYAYINFDDERLVGLRTEDLSAVVDAFYTLYGDVRLLLFDEIQNIDGWELFVNRLQRQGFNIYLTGSNANLLDRELATHLTGRYLPINMLPFSFLEYLDFKRFRIDTMDPWSSKDRAMIQNELHQYIQNGGFPEVLQTKSYIKQYLQSLYSDIILKDVVGRYRIKYIRTLKDIANYLLSTSSTLMTYTRIKNKFNLKSVHTAKNYISYLADASLFVFLERFQYRPAARQTAPKKVYVIDTGLIHALSIRLTENRGLLLENIVALELLRRRALEPGMELFYWRDERQNEIDFVVRSELTT